MNLSHRRMKSLRGASPGYKISPVNFHGGPNFFVRFAAAAGLY
jgi:hypothetical protein